METKHIDERDTRIQRLETLRNTGINPYPSTCLRTHTIEALNAQFKEGGKKPVIVGRVRALRRHGGSTFIELEDGTGKFQVFCSRNEIPELYEKLVKLLDMGDFLQVTGEQFRTKQGQPTLKAVDLRLLSKAIRPLPEQFHGLANTEKRYRQRELDLIANESSRNVAKVRSKLLSLLRKYFEDFGFLEVETPILQAVAGGATAKPFKTHHNALNTDLYLRVAPELYLKRLIVGGFEKVYEVARCFRNEGISPQHNPEFTQIECYAAYWDYQEMMKFCEEILVKLVDELLGKLEVIVDGKVVDFTPPLPRLSFIQLLQNATGLDVTTTSDKELQKAVIQHGGDAGKNPNRGKLIDELWKTTVRPTILRPTFILDYPVELSPLAKKSDKNPKILDMFQLVIAGSEVIKAFTELNDPIDQRQRFAEQEALRKKGDEEAQGNDPTFLTSLEYGMPPTAGAGIGIDRLAAILSGSHSIKEVILFPTLRSDNADVSL